MIKLSSGQAWECYSRHLQYSWRAKPADDWELLAKALLEFGTWKQIHVEKHRDHIQQSARDTERPVTKFRMWEIIAEYCGGIQLAFTKTGTGTPHRNWAVRY